MILCRKMSSITYHNFLKSVAKVIRNKEILVMAMILEAEVDVFDIDEHWIIETMIRLHFTVMEIVLNLWRFTAV